MKKLIIYKLVLIFVVTGFVSCGKYEDGPAFSLLRKITRMTGTWQLKETLENGSKPEEDFLESIGIEMTLEKDGKGKYDLFFSNLKFAAADLKWDFTNDKENLKVTVKGDDVEWFFDPTIWGSMPGNDFDIPEDEDFEFSDDFFAEFLSFEARILRLTNSELWLEDIVEENGETTVITFKFTKKD